MQIELGLIGAVALMGGSVQLRILRILQRKLREIAEEQRRRDEEAELNASGRFAELDQEKEEWEKQHGPNRMHNRNGSGYSGTPLINDDEGFSSTPTLSGAAGSRGHYGLGLSDFVAAPAPDELSKRRNPAPRDLLPNLELGTRIQEDVPSGFITMGEVESKESKEAKDAKKAEISAELEQLTRKEELLAEIQTIRRSIDALRTDTPGVDSDDSRSRRVSLSSKRTLSTDLENVMGVRPHARPPRQPDPRGRTHSMELSKMIDAPPLGASISRPTSVPLKEEDWDSYVRDRKLLQPPSGVTAPIPTTPVSQRMPISPAVSEALAQRKQRESMLDLGSDDVPLRETSEEDEVAIAASLAGIVKTQVKKQRPRPTSIVPPVLFQQPGTAPAPHEPPSVNQLMITTRPRLAKASPVEATNSNIPIVLPPTLPLKTRPEEPPSSTPFIIPRGGAATGPEQPQRVATFEELEERHRQKMKGMQAPLTEAVTAHAELEAARDRWERSRAIEKVVVGRRQAEKAAQHEREEKSRRKPQDGMGKRGSPLLDFGKNGDRSLNALSADKLAVKGTGPSTRRQSQMRVEDWQRHQQDIELGVRPDLEGSKRESRAVTNATVPFPGQAHKGGERRRASGPLPH